MAYTDIEKRRAWDRERGRRRRAAGIDWKKSNRERVNSQARARYVPTGRPIGGQKKAVCPQGHPRVAANLTTDGRCRPCRLARTKEWRESQTPEARLIWLNLTRNRRRGYSTARRARKRNQFIEHVDPLVVFERDEGICGICDRPAELGAFHVDHIIPLSRGGMHGYANVQTAHPDCNLRKGAKLPTDR